MTVLLLGAGGMLGSDLARSAPAGVELHRTHRAQLDITNDRAVAAALDRLHPDIVINATAYSAVDRAESDRAAALAVNGTAVAALARACAARGISIVHFSTDYVFGGSGALPYREGDPVSPVNAYGETKLAGERGLLDSAATALLIRTQWLFGVNGRSFPRTMWERARARQQTRVVMDQSGRPTFTMDLATAVWKLLGIGATGVFHMANSGEATWYDVAVRVFAAAGVPELVSPCSTAEFPTPAHRPSYSVLETSKLEHTLGAALPSGVHALERFLRMIDQAPAEPATLR